MTNTQRSQRLAILGGSPTFNEPLHVGRPNIGSRQAYVDHINDMFDRRWFTNNGPYVQKLEQRLAAYLDVKHVIAVCNATIGLELVIQAIGLTGEVVVPSFTFVATAHALQWQKIKPVFCDIDPVTHNADPASIENLITPRTTGIMPVHVWGRPCDTDALGEIASRHNLNLIYDAAHAFGCAHRGRMIGCYGDAEVFSFHATKFFSTFEGGAITTNDDALAEKVRLMRNFGFAGKDTVIYLGINAKMSEASAALGLVNLDSVDSFIATNQTHYTTYQNALQDIPGIRMMTYDGSERNNYQYVIVEVDATATGIDRDTLVNVLHAERILARRYFYPGCHQMEPYRTLYPRAGEYLPETVQLSQRVMSLPTGTAVSKDDILTIAAIIRQAVNCADVINAAVDDRQQSADKMPPDETV
jgi:dTDP-4-amino-4,6-dideoxygalactose transaminase